MVKSGKMKKVVLVRLETSPEDIVVCRCLRAS